MSAAVDGDCDQKGFGEPEAAVGEARSSPGAKHGACEKTKRDQTEVASLAAALFAGFARSGGNQGVVKPFGYVTEITGNEGGVEGEAVDPAETGDLNGRYIRNDSGKCHGGESIGKPAEGEDSHDLEHQTDK